MNKNVPEFLTPAQARQWAVYFGKELGYKVSYDYYYDNLMDAKYNSETEGRRINYSFMSDYKFGLTQDCKKNIEKCVKDDRMIKFYLKKKGMSFVYVVRYEELKPALQTPIIIDMQYNQMELKDFITM